VEVYVDGKWVLIDATNGWYVEGRTQEASAGQVAAREPGSRSPMVPGKCEVMLRG
jgi:transglutaminase-like putative cysteine protease